MLPAKSLSTACEREITMYQMIQKLQLQVRVLRIYCLFLSLTVGSFIILGLMPKNDTDDIIRTKGIIITDKEGNDRILIGAPAPDSKSRIRSDFEKAKKAW